MSGQQTYYVPEQSKFALITAIFVAFTIIGVAGWFNSMTFGSGGATGFQMAFYGGLIGFLVTLGFWFKQAISENIAGMNSAQLKKSYAIGMLWFIGSEAFFFLSFFGALFYVRVLAGHWLASDSEAIIWQGFEYNWPMMTTPQDAVGIENQAQANIGTYTGPEHNMAVPGFAGLLTWVPFWNTLCLISSSVTVHIAHVAMKNDDRQKFNLWLGITLLLAFIFVGLQIFEYYEAYAHLGLKLSSGIYGSTFFMLTGFHGFHVCMGAIMLSVQWMRSIFKQHFTHDDCFGFEASSWYWHFVDVVWIGLVLFVYVI